VSVTIKDVAQQAGVSVCTVSRIINGKPSVYPFSEATRKRVLKTAQELGYAASVLGRGMRARKTFTVAFAVRAENINHVSCVKNQHGLSQALARGGYSLATLHISEWRESLRKDVTRHDGLVLGPNLPEDVLENLRAIALPKVELNTLSDCPVDCVEQDDFAMGRSLAEHLAGLGYRTFVFLSKSGVADYAGRRLAGLREISDSHGIDLAIIDRKSIRIRDYLAAHGKEDLRRTVFVDAGAVAEVSAAFYIGVGMGKEAPRDFGLASCHLEPPDTRLDGKRLTGICLNVEEKAAAAGEMLLAKLTGPDKPMASVTFSYKLVRGQTTSKIV